MKRRINFSCRRIFFSFLVGLLSGLSASLFLFLLDWVTLYRESHPAILFALPLAGLTLGWIFHRFGKGMEKGSSLIIEEIERDFSVAKSSTPVLMAPLVLLGTLVTHLFGGSSGREGTAVQMGASLADQVAQFFKISPQERKRLLIAGAGSGFGAAVGAPWAGVIFGMEMLQIGPVKLEGLFESLVAAWVAFETTHLLKTPHSLYPLPQIPLLSAQGLATAALGGLCFGVLAMSFSKGTHALERFFSKYRIPSFYRPFLGGSALTLFYLGEGMQRFAGLGISVIQNALKSPAAFSDVVWKFLVTVVTLGSGFKGGEFIPLVFMGTCLGSALSQWTGFSGLSFDVLGALGFAAVFAAASNTPLACSVMAMELFGGSIAPLALMSCFVAYFVSGHHGIYHSQKIKRPKTFWLKWPF